MINQSSEFKKEFEQLVQKIDQMLSGQQPPVVIALDGGSGAGKSTLAVLLKEHFDIALIPLDDFFSEDIPDHLWDHFSVQQKRKKVFKWDKLRNQCLNPLIQGNPAKWRAFDFESGLRSDGTYELQDELKKRNPANVILIEGAYSASPELADLVDLSILINVPKTERHKRLKTRDGKAWSKKWLRRWEEVEDFYFNELRPANYFDFVLTNKYAGA